MICGVGKMGIVIDDEGRGEFVKVGILIYPECVVSHCKAMMLRNLRR